MMVCGPVPCVADRRARGTLGGLLLTRLYSEGLVARLAHVAPLGARRRAHRTATHWATHPSQVRRAIVALRARDEACIAGDDTANLSDVSLGGIGHRWRGVL